MFILIILQLFLSSTNPDSKSFQDYLEQHHIEPQQDQVFALLSQYSCTYCTKNGAGILNALEGCSKLVVITGNKKLYDDLKDKLTVVFDEKYEFDYLPYNFSNMNLIQLKGNELKIESFGLKDQENLKNRMHFICDEQSITF